MKFKEYKKEYENVFTRPDVLGKCKVEKVDVLNMDFNIYVKALKKTLKDYTDAAYDALVKYVWLSRRFIYDGERQKKLYQNGIKIDAAFALFIRNIVGLDSRVLTRNSNVYKVVTYFDEFYPDFDVNNPFEQKYEFPYKHITLEYLVMVNYMPERLKLIDIAEKHKMSYLKFSDYIVNYISCYNEAHGKQVFDFVFTSEVIPYVRYNKQDKKYEGNKT